MLKFAEYVVRCDETSFNPMPYGGSGLAQTALGVAASPIAAASGLGQLIPRAKGYRAFEPARDFLLDLNAKNPAWKPYLLWVIHSAEEYFQHQKPTDIEGVPMGNQGGKVAAALGMLVKAAWISLRNVIHTIGNVKSDAVDKVMPQVQAMLYGLDTIPKEKALDRLEEFKQRVQSQQGNDSIDPDARMYKPFFSR